MTDDVIAEILEVRVVSSRGRRNPRAVKRKMSGFPTKLRCAQPATLHQLRVLIVGTK
jgi:hypothetical protein